MFRTLILNRFIKPTLVAIAATALVAGAENTKKPISRDRLFRAVEIGGLSNDEFVGIVRDFGVDFELNAEDKTNLKKSGVDETVIAAIADNYRDPLKEKLQQLSNAAPLNKDNIVGLLKAGAGADIVEVMVEKRGVTFAMTPAEAKEIESAGGNKALLGALLLKEPVKVPAPAKGPEPALVAASTPSAVVVPQASPATTQSVPAQSMAAQNATAQAAPVAANNTPAPAQPTLQPVTAPAAAVGQANAAQGNAPSVPQANGPQPGAKPINQAAALLTSSAKPAKLITGKVSYTEVARRANVRGKVVLEIVIDEHGRVDSVKGISGNPLLVMSASQSTKEWLYEPATVDGRPTKVTTQVNVNFE